MYKIEKNIPVPVSNTDRYRKYPLKEMELYDSFSVPKEETKPENLSSYLHMYGKRNDKKYMTRSMDNEYRIWRIK